MLKLTQQQVNTHQEHNMSKIQERRKAAQQEIQEHKAKKNKYIIAAVFWFLASIAEQVARYAICVFWESASFGSTIHVTLSVLVAADVLE